MKKKKCSKCKHLKRLDEFGSNPRSADGRAYACLECQRKRYLGYHATHKQERNAAARKRRLANPEADREYQSRYRARFPWRNIYQHAKKRAAKFGWKFDLDKHIPEFKARVALMRCEMTGMPLIPGVGAGSQGKRFWNTASLDRIDPAKGYTYRNIRIVCWAMNCAMGTWGEKVLRTMVKAWMEK